uniref:Uncharacterized protein n=1 Tax=Anguilla anguilla TaxID=7936 RepID=A0A0E9V441_ANGAN
MFIGEISQSEAYVWYAGLSAVLQREAGPPVKSGAWYRSRLSGVQQEVQCHVLLGRDRSIVFPQIKPQEKLSDHFQLFRIFF